MAQNQRKWCERSRDEEPPRKDGFELTFERASGLQLTFPTVSRSWAVVFCRFFGKMKLFYALFASEVLARRERAQPYRQIITDPDKLYFAPVRRQISKSIGNSKANKIISSGCRVHEQRWVQNLQQQGSPRAAIQGSTSTHFGWSGRCKSSS